MSCNRVILIGNLVEEPELRYTPNTNTPVGKLRIAVTRTFNRDESDFFNVVTWRKTAENCANHLKKGSQVCVEGRLQVRSYDAQDGTKRWVTEVIADQVHFLGSRQQGQQSQPAQQDSLEGWEQLGKMADDDTVPF